MNAAEDSMGRFTVEVEVANNIDVVDAERGLIDSRPQIENVWLELLGRHGVFKATLEPQRDTALIGAIVLEDLDLLVDCKNQRLFPRDPRFVISEIE